VRVKLVTVRNFVLCASLAGLVGLLEAIRSQTIQPDPSGPNELLLIAIAGAVIGGTLLTGGSGTVVGAFIGALFLGILKDGLILQGVNANYLLFYTGLAIVIAMTANVYVGRVRRGHAGGG
jgi:simple sugar transport system permease protein